MSRKISDFFKIKPKFIVDCSINQESSKTSTKIKSKKGENFR